MVKRKRVWTYVPPRERKHTYKVPDAIKDELEQRAKQIIESKFKPYTSVTYKESKELNYVVDVYTKWWRNFFYFYCKFRCPSPNAISEYFEDPFTRMEYIGDGRFNLSYMRHTGQWWQVYTGLTLKEALKTIEEERIFYP